MGKLLCQVSAERTGNYRRQSFGLGTPNKLVADIAGNPGAARPRRLRGQQADKLRQLLLTERCTA